MKKLLLLSITTILLMSFSSQSPFCEGFEDGYEYGYCYDLKTEQPDPFCIEPIPPLCPLPGLNENTYEGGYARGFLRGIRDQK